MELISREAVLLEIHEAFGDSEENGLTYVIKNLPTIESRPKGKWVSVDWANEYFDCSICGNRRRGTSKYCEDCGAEMREVERVKGLSERMVIKNDKWLIADMRGGENGDWNKTNSKS